VRVMHPGGLGTMKMNGKTFFAKAVVTVGLTLSSLVAPALADNLTIKHAQGETSVPSNPAKVLSFDLASLDTLTALGVDVAGVPSGPKPDYLSKYADKSFPTIGSLFEPDFEAVNAAEPDLIIVAGRSRAKYAELAKIAPTIDLTVTSDAHLAGAEENVRTLGKTFGKEAEANALIAKLQSSAAAVKEKASKAGTGLLVLTTGGKMSTFGPGSRFGVLFADYGIKPADETIKVGMHGQPASFEYILEKDPDWLFVIDRDAAIGRGGVAAAKLLDNEIVRRTKAWKKGHVVYLDPVSWYIVGDGITSLQKTVDELSAALDKP
jgi:iron complex transport system substrate-binding protein